MIEKIKNYKFLITTIASIVIGFCIFIWNLSHSYYKVLEKYDILIENIKTTKQMALKSIIWSDDIPISDQMSACDEYIDSGFNSLTKKHCENILERRN